MWDVTIALVLILLGLVWSYDRKYHGYWRSQGIDGPSPTPINGNAGQLFLGKRWEFIRKNYEKFKHKKFFGLYQRYMRILCVCDLDNIRNILIKDFMYFTDRRHMKIEGNTKWMNEMLSITTGDKWKKLRSTLSPTFSSGKIKNMFSIVNDKVNIFIECIRSSSNKNNELDIKEVFGRYTLDVVGSTAFGVNFNTLVNEDSQYSKYMQMVNPTTWFHELILAGFFVYPTLTKIMLTPLAILFKNRDPWTFFKNVSKETIEARSKEEIKRNDFVDLILDEQRKQQQNFDETKSYKITDDTVYAQSVLFLIAGYDTTANTLSVATFNLGKYQNKQNILRTELQTIVKENGCLDYQSIMEAKYLDAWVSETLRLNPPSPWLERNCTIDYQVPNSNLVIHKDTLVLIPVWGIHRDPEYWENPDSFQPERFLPENKDKIVSMSYMPFGLGPRNCLAMRFALMEVKVCLAHMVLNYKIKLAPGKEELVLCNGGQLVKPHPSSIRITVEQIN